MKKVAWSVAAALALSMSAPAFAADMPVKAAPAPAVVAAPSPWDIAFGAAVMNDVPDTYVSGTAKFTAPSTTPLGPFGWYVSGEFGRQYLGTTNSF